MSGFYEALQHPYTIVGFAGQGLFFSRFLVQWIATERAGKTVVPALFWYLSVAGAMLTLIYAIQRTDPVFVLAQLLAMLIYTRNIVIQRRALARNT